MERDTRSVVEEKGGTIIGSTRTALNEQDFSDPIFQAQSSGAQVVAAALAGSDAVNFMKAASEFGLSRGKQKIALLSATINHVAGMGLDTARGLQLVETFYWDMSDETRA